MIIATAKHKKFLMEALLTRFNLSFLEVYDKVKKVEIGDVKYLNADFVFFANTVLKKDISN